MVNAPAPGFSAPRHAHVALMVGASRGIGAACAEAFARRGAMVCLLARNEARLSSLDARLRGQGLDCWSRAVDISDTGAVEQAVADVMETFGRLDTVIDLAAVTGPLDRASWEIEPADWAAVMSTNLDGVYNLVRASIPAMLRRGEGRFLLASSPFGEMVTPGMGAYAVSRAAANALLHQTAAELHGSGVGAAVVYPGVTETEGLAEFRQARGGAAGMAPSVPAEVMANLFVWAAMLPPTEINGEVLAWSNPAVRAQVMQLPPA